MLWTLLCGLSAAPSYIIAFPTFNHAAMFTGIALFIVLYTITTSTPAFLRFRERPFVRRTLYIGYGTRILIAVVFPLGIAVDLIPGAISIGIVGEFFPGPFVGHGPGSARTFLPTLLITIVQGTLLNILLSVYMAIIWYVQKRFCKEPAEHAHGFPVEPLAQERREQS